MDPIEERTLDYANLMDALLEKLKVDLTDYVHDIAIAAWNSALSEACFEIDTFLTEGSETKAEMAKDIADAIRLRRM